MPAKPSVSCPITLFTSISHIKSNCGSLGIITKSLSLVREIGLPVEIYASSVIAKITSGYANHTSHALTCIAGLWLNIQRQ